ncbi:MAG: hypothetical protein GX567_11515 [Clostridia bacterium]|nr:hypothetical protein [Clostridia bacterium]
MEFYLQTDIHITWMNACSYGQRTFEITRVCGPFFSIIIQEATNLWE